MKKLLIFLSVMISWHASGQDSLTYEYIDSFDRSSIIALAKERVDEYLDLSGDTSFDYSLIDTIRILKNRHKYFVRFEQLIKFVPLNMVCYYGFDVDLIDQSVRMICMWNIESADKPYKFYHPNNEDQEKKEFVLKAISLSDPKEPITIFEKETCYEIGYISSGEKVDKISGTRYDTWDELLMFDPEETLMETKTE